MAEFEELSTRTALLSEHYPVCRICLQDDNLQELIRPCICKGTHRFVHRECASEWLKVSKKTTCDICGVNYCFLKRSLRPISEWNFPVPISEELEDQIDFLCCIFWILFNLRIIFTIYKGGISEVHAELVYAFNSTKIAFLWWLSLIFNSFYYSSRCVVLFDKWISDNSEYEWAFNNVKNTEDSIRT